MHIRWTVIACAVALLSIASAAGLKAQPRDRAVIQQEFDATFYQMLKNPSDESIALRYSALAEALGDYEAAIPPLERLLILNPERMDLKLRAGKMYYRLKSYDMAKAYMKEIMQSDQATIEQKKQAKEHLDEIKWKVY